MSPITGHNKKHKLYSIIARDDRLYSITYETQLSEQMLHYNQLTLSRLSLAMQTTHGPHFCLLSKNKLLYMRIHMLILYILTVHWN